MNEEVASVASLRRIQNFDANSLVRKDELGSVFQFAEAVEPAKELISIFKKLPLDSLGELPENEREVVRSTSDNVYNIFSQILEFDATQAEAQSKRKQLIEQIGAQKQPAFTKLHPLISYAVTRAVDFNAIESQGRATLQQLQDESQTAVKSLEETKEEAARILDSVRQAAAEQGVAQKALYFSGAADNHAALADQWQKYTVAMAIILVCYGVLSLFIHKISYLMPVNSYEAAQLIASKVLIFAVLSYLLLLCGRNFLSHRHNEIVNRHRQNALLTYNALVEAGATQESRDIVLNHAAASIYRKRAAQPIAPAG